MCSSKSLSEALALRMTESCAASRENFLVCATRFRSANGPNISSVNTTLILKLMADAPSTEPPPANVEDTSVDNAEDEESKVLVR